MSISTLKFDKKFFKTLCYKYNIAAFVLFGSHATGFINPLSDIDIACLPKRKLSYNKENKLFVEIAEKLCKNDVDLVDLTRASLLLKYSVVNFGKILACIDQRMMYEFIVQTRHDYLDTASIRWINSYYLKMKIQERVAK